MPHTRSGIVSFHIHRDIILTDHLQARNILTVQDHEADGIPPIHWIHVCYHRI